jgi:ABC-type multidrug transport system fused ATPase/permease subunit
VTAKTKGKLQESIEGIQELKQLNNEEKTLEELKEQINKISAKTIKRGKFAAMGTESVSFLMNTSQVLITIIIGIFIVQGNLSIGDYMALTQYVLMLYAPVQLLATFSMTIQPGLAALERIGDILSEDTEKRTSGISVESIDHIEFRNVSFHYETRGTILNNVTFTMKKGENVSLEGVNGSGKSTIVKLLLGLYPDYSGVININGINLKDINIKSLRDKVGIVSQNVILFSGTLLDNIKMANPNISDEGLGQLLEIFNDKMFQDMDPYAMMISEKGNNLSGGQRQKIAILRAMAKDPEILIFDEATSNLDNASKMLLKNAICNIFDEKTCIIISHEEEISGLSDIVLQVDEGTVTKKVRPAVIYEFDKR